MTSQLNLQTVAINVLPNISPGKGKQTIKFVKIIEYNKQNILLQNLGRETNSGPLFISLKSLI